MYEGEFRLVPASVFGELIGDHARQDNELLRIQSSPAHQVEIIHQKTGKRLTPIGDVTYKSEILTDYYTLCFSSSWNIALFDEFHNSDACLIIHKPEEVCERIHFFANRFLQDWSSLDARVTYGGRSDFGAFYLKDPKYTIQDEWRFTWVPPDALKKLTPFNIKIGSIENFAEIVLKPK
ncbi:MAG: hypothetical protein WBL28_00380 [Methylotenera sp.]